MKNQDVTWNRLDQLPSDSVAKVKLYKLSGMVLATLFGSPIAAGYLMSRNYRALGMPSEARNAMFFSIFGMIVFVAVAMYLDTIATAPNSAYFSTQMVAVYLLVKKYQGNFLENHKEVNGNFNSNWKAVGISLLLAIVITIVVFSLIFTWTVIESIYNR